MAFGISQSTDGHNTPFSDFLTDNGLKHIGAVGPNGEPRTLPRREPTVDRLEKMAATFPLNIYGTESDDVEGAERDFSVTLYSSEVALWDTYRQQSARLLALRQEEEAARNNAKLRTLSYAPRSPWARLNRENAQRLPQRLPQSAAAAAAGAPPGDYTQHPSFPWHLLATSELDTQVSEPVRAPSPVYIADLTPLNSFLDLTSPSPSEADLSEEECDFGRRPGEVDTWTHLLSGYGGESDSELEESDMEVDSEDEADSDVEVDGRRNYFRSPITGYHRPDPSSFPMPSFTFNDTPEESLTSRYTSPVPALPSAKESALGTDRSESPPNLSPPSMVRLLEEFLIPPYLRKAYIKRRPALVEESDDESDAVSVLESELSSSETESEVGKFDDDDEILTDWIPSQRAVLLPMTMAP